MTSWCLHFTMSTKPNDPNKQPPDNELALPDDEGEMNNKIEPLASTFGNKKAPSILCLPPSPLRSKRRVRLEHDAEKLHPSSSKKRRRYQRRNSKVASMLAPSVAKRSDEESLPSSSTKDPPCSATKNGNDEQEGSSQESTFEIHPDESSDSEKGAEGDSRKRASC